MKKTNFNDSDSDIMTEIEDLSSYQNKSETDDHMRNLSSPCTCCESLPPASKNPSTIVTTSGLSIRIKEVIILSLVFLLLLYSIILFLNKWSKSYRQIIQPPFQYPDQDDLSADGKLSTKLENNCIFNRSIATKSMAGGVQ